ncbi:hypothetical protein [Aquamicrobium sp. LC103]|uniref:hypothetical protein n=1 Tax=Aquamicrobium sp. LC103 TaxID=1120658 RepID=UPI00063E7F6C|nr:hypothetical protein [Aquamicrobium sp. LC103]TKT78405.1 hypothetical protein XW59_012375 [Aquamicrobium sp. LC103]
MNWTPDIVMVRLIEAYAVIERITRKDGPPGTGSGMPAAITFESSQEAFEFERVDLTFNNGESMAVIKETRRQDILRAAGRAVPAETISMALEALRWPIDFIQDEDHRACLITYATCRARNRVWTKVLKARNARVPKEKRWLRLKTYRWNEKSCQRISDHLAKESVLLRLPLDLQMIQIEAEHPCEFANLAKRAWMAPDAMPSRFGGDDDQPGSTQKSRHGERREAA